MKISKFFIVGILFFIVPTLFLSFVSADSFVLLCLQKGEQVRFSECNPQIPDRTCGSDFGCPYCTKLKDSGVYCPANINVCNSLGLSCSYLTNSSIDAQPPILIVNNPIQDSVYNKRAVLLDLQVNEESDLTYIDNINGRGRWSNICKNCYSYNNSRSFKEGLNNITIKAEDVVGNPAYFNVSFFVDSKKPIIKKTEPKNNKFADGEFIVTYYEENPEEIFLTYGNNLTGYRNALLSGCVGGKRAECGIDINLADYDGEEIEYWFNITDIAGNFDDSIPARVKVDVTAPVITYFNYNISGKYVTFNFTITEQNFDKVEYIDAFELRPRWRTLCSRLRDGSCVKKISFKPGEHNLDIQVNDEAGNAVGFPVSFVI